MNLRVTLSDHAFSDILAPGESRVGIVPNGVAIGGEDSLSKIISEHIKEIRSEPEAHLIGAAGKSPAI